MSDRRALLVRLADGGHNKKIRYREFDRYLNKKVLHSDFEAALLESNGRVNV